MAKILFAHPLFLSKSPSELASVSPYFPLGLLYLAAYVREHGHEVTIFDGTFAEDETAFSEALETDPPDAVGISALLPTRAMALQLASIAKDRSLLVIMGGPDPTSVPELYAADPHVDLVVHHEGEQTITRLLDLMDIGELDEASLVAEPGIAFKHNGSHIVNPPREPIEDLDTLPLPARDLIDMDRYLRVWEETNGYSSLTIATSRGCPYGCDWCRDAVHGNQFRQRSPGNVALEMSVLKESYDIGRLRMVDDVDGIDRVWLESWAEAARDSAAALPFEALSNLSRQDIPLLDTRDSL